ncbi:hypothetical protein [Mesorhizobium captivum]|uniref:hypothetical protein n=1 Tax=Mesorhizobium captivum TaxID=3072319 RepID=UPI002A247DF3|nr:hypothetical protein [Mesorhizobium sp. VK22E]MDX8508060.1 hypothetical protein [Mesorhizobium sp. VK22E]
MKANSSACVERERGYAEQRLDRGIAGKQGVKADEQADAADRGQPEMDRRETRRWRA